MPLSFFHQGGWLAAASFLAGALNAVAGGGSFLSFPALLGVGVLPIAANATNTVALWPGQLTSIAAYREDLGVNLRLLVPVSISALLGGLGGAVILLRTGQRHQFSLGVENRGVGVPECLGAKFFKVDLLAFVRQICVKACRLNSF